VPEFAERWQAHEVARKRRGTKIVVHPQAGPLRIDFEVLVLNDDTDRRMVTWLPGDEATAAAFDRLCADATAAATSPAQLRVVG
jgi:hypothetical protein